jgi:hypothetical protein
MKAEVFPAKSTRLDIPSWLPDIPPWLPDVIAQSVCDKYAAAVDEAYRAAFREYFEPEVLDDWYLNHLLRDDDCCASVAGLVNDDELVNMTERYLPLVNDLRMRGVWRELSRQRNGGFRYPAIGIDLDAAMLEVFNVALACRAQSKTTTTQRQAELERDHYLARADELRDDSFTLLTESPRGMSLERYQKLQDAAQAYEDHANEIYAANMLVALERRHDGRARWVALTIGNKFRALFGQPMYGQTATVASVVLGREIDSRTVQHWLQTMV